MIRNTALLFPDGSDIYRVQALETRLAETLPPDTFAVMLYQCPRSILLGSRMSLSETFDRDAFARCGGLPARRRSGGGAFYTDAGVLSFSMLMPRAELIYDRQMALVSGWLNRFGLQCAVCGQADLSSDGRIMLESAFLREGGYAIHHGTLMVSADLERRAAYLPQSMRYDLTGRGAVPGNLTEQAPATVRIAQESFCDQLQDMTGMDPMWLDERMIDAAAVEEMRTVFSDEAWIGDPEPGECRRLTERFSWGTLTAAIQVEQGFIRKVHLFTDAMESLLFDGPEQFLEGCPVLVSAVGARFEQGYAGLKDARLMGMVRDMYGTVCRCIDSVSAG